MKNLIKLTKKFILPGVFLVGLLFIASFAQAKLLKVLPGGGVPTHYKISTFKVNGTHGTISPFYRDVLPGGTASFSVVPNGGYMAEYTGAATGAICIGHYYGTTYTTAPINADCTLAVTFVLKPPVVIRFYPTNKKVNVGVKPVLNWDVTGANYCWVTGPNNYKSKNFTKNHPSDLLTVDAISVPSTYYLHCTTDAIGTPSTTMHLNSIETIPSNPNIPYGLGGQAIVKINGTTVCDTSNPSSCGSYFWNAKGGNVVQVTAKAYQNYYGSSYRISSFNFYNDNGSLIYNYPPLARECFACLETKTFPIFTPPPEPSSASNFLKTIQS